MESLGRPSVSLDPPPIHEPSGNNGVGNGTIPLTYDREPTFMLQDAAERIEETRTEVHEWSDKTITQAVVLFLFYGGLTITGLGILVVLMSYVVARK